MTDEFAGWRKSTRCESGACIEVGIARWRKSNHSGTGNCIEVGAGPAVVGVRDTELKDASPVLKFSEDAWTAFTEGIKTR